MKLTAELENRARNTIATLRPYLETIERLAPEIEKQEQIKSWLLSQEAAARTDADRRDREKGRLAVNAWIELLNKQLAEARQQLAPYLTSASHFAREVSSERRAAAHAKAKAQLAPHVGDERAEAEANSASEVALIDSTIIYLESLGADAYERGKRLVALLESTFIAE